jgi:hypothetical protein
MPSIRTDGQGPTSRPNLSGRVLPTSGGPNKKKKSFSSALARGTNEQSDIFLAWTFCSRFFPLFFSVLTSKDEPERTPQSRTTSNVYCWMEPFRSIDPRCFRVGHSCLRLKKKKSKLFFLQKE